MAIAVLTALFVAFAAPVHAAIEITEIKFNPRGREAASNENLSREYILITNTGDTRRNLKGWKIHDRGRDHVFRFRRRTLLRPDEYAYVYSGRGADAGSVGCNGHCVNSYFLHWDSEDPVWTNSGDVATLINRAGDVIDRCRYGSAASSPKRC